MGKIQSAREFSEEVWMNVSTIDLIRSRDKAIVKAVISILDHHASFDPHGVVKPDGSSDGILHFNDALRAELRQFMEDVSKEIP